MKNFLIILLVLLAFTATGCSRKRADTESGREGAIMVIKSFRVLVIIGDQWTDPFTPAPLTDL